MRIIDLRSDTVTKPTEEMLEEMIRAEVGDDVYGEDPTVNKLEKLAAQILGKESALFVTSGTQGNQIAVLCQTHRGDEVILERSSHIYLYEVGGLSALSGVQPFPIDGIKGVMNIEEIEKSIRRDNIHYPRTALICLENTHNRSGGTVLPLDYVKNVCGIAEKYGIRTHLDGARLFNASVALGIAVSDLAKPFDSVQICLSKGLSAPVGSILAGNQQFIQSARKYRKMLGGGMRQAGVIAAAGIIAMTKMVDRLTDDHMNAHNLANGLSKFPELVIDMDSVHTNMVYGDIVDPGINIHQLDYALKEHYIRIHIIDSKTFRLVTHKDIEKEDIPVIIEKFNWFFQEGRYTKSM